MRKEVIFAILLGGLFGVGLAFGIWKLNSTQNSSADNRTPAPLALPKQQNGVASLALESNGLMITHPNPGNIVKESRIAFSGKFEPSKMVTVSTESKDYLLTTSADGAFETAIEPKSGVNSVIVTGFGASKAQIESVFTYSTAQSSPNSQVVIGRITDKTDNGLQIDATHGQVVQVSIDPDKANFVSMVTTTKDITFEDVGIGDYVSIIGTPSTQNMFVAERVIITTTPNTDSRKVFQGTVSNLTRNQFTLNTEGKALTIKSSGSVSYFLVNAGNSQTARFSNIKDDQNIIAVGKATDTTFEPRSVFILQ